MRTDSPCFCSQRDEIRHFWRVFVVVFLLLRKCIEEEISLARGRRCHRHNLPRSINSLRFSARLNAMRNGAQVDDSENRNCNSVDNGAMGLCERVVCFRSPSPAIPFALKVVWSSAISINTRRFIPIAGTLCRYINWIRYKCRSVSAVICRVTSKIDVHLLVFIGRSNQHIFTAIPWSSIVLQPSHANQFRLVDQFSPLIKQSGLTETRSICLFRTSIPRFDRNQN